MPFCSACGHQGADHARFCTSCGQSLSTPSSSLSTSTHQQLLPSVVKENGAGDHYIAQGVNGQVELTGNRIRITRKGFMGFLTQGLKGDKEILISQISSVQLRPAGNFARGYIQFAFMGSQESKSGLFDSVNDENSVLFDKKHQEAFNELKQRIDVIMDAMARPATPVVAAPSSVDEIEKLASLHSRGILTDAEFDIKKRELLGL